MDKYILVTSKPWHKDLLRNWQNTKRNKMGSNR